ncbi:MAG: CAAD domain-containing protein [Synechococcus sp.]|nr:CAAD domain-containing protein [Synechococcus sp.]
MSESLTGSMPAPWTTPVAAAEANEGGDDTVNSSSNTNPDSLASMASAVDTGANADAEPALDATESVTATEQGAPEPELAPSSTAAATEPATDAVDSQAMDSQAVDSPAPEHEQVARDPVVADPVVPDPVIAERITIPASSHSDDSTATGGEWDLLTAKVSAWWESNDMGTQINNLRQPLRVVASLIAVILVLKVYAGVLAAIGSIPLAPRLLELVGVIWVARFAATRMVRSSDRRVVLDGLRQRWSQFSGKN